MQMQLKNVLASDASAPGYLTISAIFPPKFLTKCCFKYILISKQIRSNKYNLFTEHILVPDHLLSIININLI